MTTTNTRSGSEAFLDAGRTFFQQKRNKLQDVLARRKIYRRTYHELAMLSDRDLADLGIPRSHIRKLAMEAAYDC